MPETCNSRAVFAVPAEMITSRRARTSVRAPPRSVTYRMPTARLPSKTMPQARALVRTSSSGRAIAGLQEGARRGDAPAILDAALEIPDAGLVAAVVVRVARHPAPDAAFEEGLRERMDPVHVGDRQPAFACHAGRRAPKPMRFSVRM